MPLFFINLESIKNASEVISLKNKESDLIEKNFNKEMVFIFNKPKK